MYAVVFMNVFWVAHFLLKVGMWITFDIVVAIYGAAVCQTNSRFAWFLDSKSYTVLNF